MEAIEQAILKLETQKDQDVQKYNLLFAKSVYQAADKSGQCSQNQARQFKKVFPELEDMGAVISQQFNPHFVIEFVEKKPTKVLRNGAWDKEDGLLPNRQVMDKYWVDIGTKFEFTQQQGEHYCTTHKKVSKMLYTRSTPVNDFQYSNSSISSYNLECGCNFHNHYQNFYKLPPKKFTKSIERAEHRELFCSTESYEWEVDNYLNLYHKPSGLYLMFNKTVFPMMGFYLSKQFSPFVFTSKRREPSEYLKQVLNTAWLQKVDNEEYLLQHIAEVTPDNYDTIFDTFNRFRRLDSFSSVAPEGIPTQALAEGEEAEDMRDQLIRSYKIRLEETMVRAEKAESYQRQMLEEYRTQSSKLQELQLELDQKLLMEQEAIQQQAQALIKEHLSKERVKLQELEASKQKNLELQTRLSEKEVAEGRLAVINSSMEVMKKENTSLSMKMEKIRNINTNLMANLQDQKKANDKLHEDNQRFHTSYLEMEVERNQIQKALQEKMAEVTKIQQQVTKLTGELVERGEQSSNCLENALSDQVEQLKAESESSRGIITELTKVNNGLVKKLEKYKKTLSVLTSDLT